MQGPLNYDLHIVDSVKSTNTVLKEAAKSGAPEGTVLVALAQTNGRGRLNRVFFSPKDTGLYLSILLRPTVPLSPSALTCMSAAALAETIEGFQISCAIKWVNDLFVQGKKVAGILTEGVIRSDGLYAYAVIGIGINLFPPENGFPETIKASAGSVFSCPYDEALRKSFLKKLLQRIKFYYEALPKPTFGETYRVKQMLFGSEVLFATEAGMRRGVASGIDDAFRLLVTCSDGTQHALNRGEVTIL